MTDRDLTAHERVAWIIFGAICLVLAVLWMRYWHHPDPVNVRLTDVEQHLERIEERPCRCEQRGPTQ